MSQDSSVTVEGKQSEINVNEEVNKLRKIVIFLRKMGYDSSFISFFVTGYVFELMERDGIYFNDSSISTKKKEGT